MRIAHILVCHTVSPRKLLESIPDSEEAFWYVFVHGKSLELVAEVQAFVAQRRGRFFPLMQNRGLARSWNDGIAAALGDECQAFLLLNDDLFFYEDGYESFVHFVSDTATLDKDVALATVAGLESGLSPHSGETHVQSFACGALTLSSVDRIGYFDENFIPAYYEDSDYFARIAKANMRISVDERVLVEHERSSTTRALSAREKELIETALLRNREYMIKKWGADSRDPPFQHPFNDSSYGVYIGRERRARPYGDHDIIPEVRSMSDYRDLA